MLEAHRRTLCGLLADMTREQGCFLVCGAAKGIDDETILLVREVIPFAPGDLRIHSPDQLSVEPSAMLRAARRAQQLGGSVCMVHTHPMCNGWVEFSEADDFGNRRTFDFFTRMLPGQPNSCLVWDNSMECVQGRVYTSSISWHPIGSVEVVSGTKRMVQVSRVIEHRETEQAQSQFDRQARLIGEEGQRILGVLRGGIIGGGGIGSLAAVLCIHSGITDLLVVDYARLSGTNLPRVIGSTPSDVGTKKVVLMKRYADAHRPNARIHPAAIPVESPELLSMLASLDFVICGTDDTTSRAYLNQLCHQYYVPILDLGVQFFADPSTEKLVKEVGRVNLMLPGSPCLACSGQIDPHLLQAEGLPANEREKRQREGYVTGVDVTEPSMMVFNMQVVGRGFQHLMTWVTGLVAPPLDTLELFQFLGLSGSESGIRRARKRTRPGCPICSESSLVMGAGDKVGMLVSPRLENCQISVTCTNN